MKRSVGITVAVATAPPDGATPTELIAHDCPELIVKL